MSRNSSNASLSSIRDLMSQFRNRHTTLQARLQQLDKALNAAEQELGSIAGNGSAVRRGPGRPRKTATMTPKAAAPMTAKSAKGRGGRPPHGQDLASVISKVLAGSSKPMRIPEIVAGAKKAGYSSASPSFSRIVGMRLMDKKRFKRVGRGVYSNAK